MMRRRQKEPLGKTRRKAKKKFTKETMKKNMKMAIKKAIMIQNTKDPIPTFSTSHPKQTCYPVIHNLVSCASGSS